MRSSLYGNQTYTDLRICRRWSILKSQKDYIFRWKTEDGYLVSIWYKILVFLFLADRKAQKDSSEKECWLRFWIQGLIMQTWIFGIRTARRGLSVSGIRQLPARHRQGMRWGLSIADSRLMTRFLRMIRWKCADWFP